MSERSVVRRWRKEAAGVAAIEFALVLPVFLLLCLAILFYGVYFSAAHAVQQIAAEAARASVAGVTNAERESLARATAAADVATEPLLDPTAMSVAVEQRAGRVRVVVSYDPATLAVWSLASLLPTPSGPIRRVGVIDDGSAP